MRSFLTGCVFAFLAFACGDEKEKQQQWNRASCKEVVDSLRSQGLSGSQNIVCYEESSGLAILEFDTTANKTGRKLTYRKGFPLYIDTLSYIKPNEFRSKRENMTYLIKDTCVLTIHYVKIIHPSSNWQGQTPWAQPYVDSYKRLDK